MIIEAKGISRHFKVGNTVIEVLKGVDFQIEEGKTVLFMGPSGSGKTTLMNQLSLLDRPTAGEVYLFNERVDDLPEKKRDELRSRQMGIIFQSVALMSKMTAYENIEFFLRVAKYPAAKRKQRVEECLSLVGLEKRMYHMPAQMSGGEQQRVAIARAIAHHPRIIFADEPTAELDTETGIHIMHLFKQIVSIEKTTLIMTTHDPNMMVYADEVIRMKDGRVERDGR